MALIERLMGIEEPKIGVHQFFGAMQEYVLGGMSGAQATAAFGLTAAEQQEALAIRDLILAVTHNTVAVQRGLREARAGAMERVLMLAEEGIAPFDTPTLVRTRLGLPIP